MGARQYLLLSDEALVSQCKVDTFRGSGPGGQKRNKTSSAVRLRHGPTGLSAESAEHRSQHANRRSALRRLRRHVALEVRATPILDQTYVPPAALVQLVNEPRHRLREQDLIGIAALIDLFVAVGCSVRDTAAWLGITSGRLSRLLLIDGDVRRKVNELRCGEGLRVLRPG